VRLLLCFLVPGHRGLTIASDKNWQCSVYQAYQNTEAPFPNYRLSESNIRFDARKELAGWNQPSFEGKLGPAIEIAFPNEMPFGKLVPRPIPMWKDSGLREYPEVVKNEIRGYYSLPSAI